MELKEHFGELLRTLWLLSLCKNPPGKGKRELLPAGMGRGRQQDRNIPGFGFERQVRTRQLLLNLLL